MLTAAPIPLIVAAKSTSPTASPLLIMAVPKDCVLSILPASKILIIEWSLDTTFIFENDPLET